MWQAAYNVQFSLSSEILAPSYIHRPTPEPDWTNKRNFCFIYLLFIDLLAIHRGGANTLHLQAGGSQ